MSDFEKEIRSMSKADLKLIIKDQKDLYSEEEFAFILKEYASRPKKPAAREKEGNAGPCLSGERFFEDPVFRTSFG